MIWDTFIFHDELDILECRLEELDLVVDRFVLVEGLETFQGNPKPSVFALNRERFARWSHKIEHVAVHLEGQTTWEREAFQRDAIMKGLWDASGQDLILLSDVDEIPTRESVFRVRSSGVTSFRQRFFCFAVDWEHPSGWRGTLASRLIEIESFSELRSRRDIAPTIAGAGWHLSWVGGQAANVKKLHSFSHNELVEKLTPTVTSGVHYTEGRHVDGVKLSPVEVDDTWPIYVKERRCPKEWFRPR